MINTLFLIIIILAVAGQNVLKKPFTQKNGGSGVYLFNAILSVAAMAFFIATSSDLQFSAAFLPYSVGFAVCYVMVSVFMVLALAEGSLSLTSLLVSYSLMMPTVYGLLFLQDPISIGLFPGIGLLLISLLLINKKDKDAKISFKWILYVVLSFVGNGMCTIIQKMQQDACDGAYKNEFMIVALGMVSVAMVIMTIATERKGFRQYLKTGWYLSLLCGVLNGVANLFVMILSAPDGMPVSVMFPLISAGGLVITFLVSKFIYKEQLSKSQFVGFLFGLAAVVLLNL